MTSETIDHTTLSKLAETGAVCSTHVVGLPGGWGIVVKYGPMERALAAQRSQQVRIFRNFETLVGYLKSVGIVRFEVDAMNWNAGSPTAHVQTRVSQATDKALEAAAYDKWLRAEVQEAIDDTSPTIPHDEVVRNVQAAIKGVRTKRAPA
jgi:hypothetical protein